MNNFYNMWSPVNGSGYPIPGNNMQGESVNGGSDMMNAQANSFDEWHQKEQIKLANSSFRNAENAQIDVWVSAEKEHIHTAEIEERAKRLADINSRRELQKLDVVLLENGGIKLTKEFFGDSLSEKVKFQYSSEIKVFSCEGKAESIFFCEFICLESRRARLFIRVSDICAKIVNRKLNGLGICFGFSREKETRARMALVNKLRNYAQEETIPLRHGWYREGDEWCYAFPNQLTWEEVEEFV